MEVRLKMTSQGSENTSYKRSSQQVTNTSSTKYKLLNPPPKNIGMYPGFNISGKSTPKEQNPKHKQEKDSTPNIFGNKNNPDFISSKNAAFERYPQPAWNNDTPQALRVSKKEPFKALKLSKEDEDISNPKQS